MSSTVFVSGVTLTSSSWFQDVDTVAYQYLTSVSGTNTITAVGPSGLGAYAAGLKFRFIPAVTNTAATTINITGAASLGARSIFFGGAALLGGELVAGVPCEIVDDGTQFHITTGPRYQTGTFTPSIGGSATYTTQTGSYTRIGRLVFVRVTLVINVIGTGSTFSVSGLPFTCAATTALYASNTTSLASTVVSISPVVTGGGTTITVSSRTAAAAADSSNAVFGNGAAITISGSYEI